MSLSMNEGTGVCMKSSSAILCAWPEVHEDMAAAYGTF